MYVPHPWPPERQTITYNGRTMSFDRGGAEHVLGGEGPIMARRFDVRPGEVVLDVDAGDSSWAIYALASGARLAYAFEPSTTSFVKLMQDVLMNDGFAERARLHNVGLDSADHVGTLEEWYRARTDDASGLVLTADCLVPVRFLPMDHYLPELPRVDWIKIDVEGGEHDVLLGGMETLKRFRPSLIIEDHRGIRGIGAYMRRTRAFDQIYELISELGGYEVSIETHEQTTGRSHLCAIRADRGRP